MYRDRCLQFLTDSHVALRKWWPSWPDGDFEKSHLKNNIKKVARQIHTPAKSISLYNELM